MVDIVHDLPLLVPLRQRPFLLVPVAADKTFVSSRGAYVDGGVVVEASREPRSPTGGSRALLVRPSVALKRLNVVVAFAIKTVPISLSSKCPYKPIQQLTPSIPVVTGG